MDSRHTFQASQVYNSSHMNGSSSYRVPPSTGYPVQPVHPPMVLPQQAVFRDNTTALTYTRNQMVHTIWMRDPQTGKAVVRPAKGLSYPGSYTDLTTGQRYTYQQMIEITGKILAEHLSRTKPRADQVQLFQAVQVQQRFQPPVQSQVRPCPIGHPLREYTDRRVYQSQGGPEVQSRRFAEQQAQMTQQGQGQQSLTKQRTHPPTQPSSDVANAGHPDFIDKLGRHWTRQQYEELVWRQQVQKVQASPEMSSGLGSQFHQAQQTLPPMIKNPQNGVHTNNMHNGIAPQTYPDQPQGQKDNRGPPPVPANSRTQQQHQYMPPPGTKRLQQSKGNLVPPSHATKASVPGNPPKQPVVHKQSVSKIQKQASRQPAASVAQYKKPSVTQPARQAVPREVKVTGKDATNRCPSPTANSTSLLPVPRSNQSNQAPMSKQPNVAPNTAPAPNPPPVPSQPTTVSQWDVENGRTIHNSMTRFLSSRQEAYHQGLSKAAAPTVTTTTTTTAAAAPAAVPPCLPDASIRAILATVKTPHYTGFSDFSERNGGVLAQVDNHELLERICTLDPDGCLRAPEPRWMSEERARLEWEMCMVGGQGGLRW